MAEDNALNKSIKEFDSAYNNALKVVSNSAKIDAKTLLSVMEAQNDIRHTDFIESSTKPLWYWFGMALLCIGLCVLWYGVYEKFNTTVNEQIRWGVIIAITSLFCLRIYYTAQTACDDFYEKKEFHHDLLLGFTIAEGMDDESKDKAKNKAKELVIKKLLEFNTGTVEEAKDDTPKPDSKESTLRILVECDKEKADSKPSEGNKKKAGKNKRKHNPNPTHTNQTQSGFAPTQASKREDEVASTKEATVHENTSQEGKPSPSDSKGEDETPQTSS